MVALRFDLLDPLGRVEGARLKVLMPGFSERQPSTRSIHEINIPLPKFLRSLILFAGLEACELRSLLIKVGSIVLGTTFLIGFFSSLLPLLAGVALVLGLYLSLSRKAFNRTEGFERDYTALLLSLASSVKSGIDPLSALGGSHRLFREGSEMQRELKAFLAKIEGGQSEDEAIETFACSINHPDLPLFRSAFSLARKEGSSLAECLQRLARVTRQRQSFRRKIRASVAMQKLSAFGIVACCICIGLVQFISNPSGFQKAIHQPAGVRLMAVGSALMVAGIWWMLRITRSRI